MSIRLELSTSPGTPWHRRQTGYADGGNKSDNLDYSFVAGLERGDFIYPAKSPGGGNPNLSPSTPASRTPRRSGMGWMPTTLFRFICSTTPNVPRRIARPGVSPRELDDEQGNLRRTPAPTARRHFSLGNRPRYRNKNTLRAEGPPYHPRR